MSATLNQDDIKLLKSVFATKEDLKIELKKSERKIIRRVDLVDKFLDREHVSLARDVDKIKVHVGLPISSF